MVAIPRRRRVKALLSAHGNAGEFMAVDAEVKSSRSPLGLDPSGPTPGRDLVGRRIGNHKLLQEIGEGGFGVVYMAEQTLPVRRRVALKIIKRREADGGAFGLPEAGCRQRLRPTNPR